MTNSNKANLLQNETDPRNRIIGAALLFIIALSAVAASIYAVCIYLNNSAPNEPININTHSKTIANENMSLPADNSAAINQLDADTQTSLNKVNVQTDAELTIKVPVNEQTLPTPENSEIAQIDTDEQTLNMSNVQVVGIETPFEKTQLDTDKQAILSMEHVQVVETNSEDKQTSSDTKTLEIKSNPTETQVISEAESILPSATETLEIKGNPTGTQVISEAESITLPSANETLETDNNPTETQVISEAESITLPSANETLETDNNPTETQVISEAKSIIIPSANMLDNPTTETPVVLEEEDNITLQSDPEDKHLSTHSSSKVDFQKSATQAMRNVEEKNTQENNTSLTIEESTKSTQSTQKKNNSALPIFTKSKTQVFSEHIKRFVIASGIKNREPVGHLANVRFDHNNFAAVYAFSDASRLAGETLYYKWYLNGKQVALIKVDVGFVRWRSYSRKLIPLDKRGDWSVTLENEKGKTLAVSRFQY